MISNGEPGLDVGDDLYETLRRMGHVEGLPPPDPAERKVPVLKIICFAVLFIGGLISLHFCRGVPFAPG